MENWDDYRFILALERSTSLRDAAQRLAVNHSTVSRRLSSLNAAHGGQLFERTRQGYQITEFGRTFLDAAEQIESIALSRDRKRRASLHQIGGEVAVSISLPLAQYLFIDALPQFRREYPAISLTIHASERIVDLDRSEADVVVRSAERLPDHLVGRRLFPYSVCYYGQRDYFRSTRTKDLTWIGNPGDPSFPEWLQASPFPGNPVALRTHDFQTRHWALMAGLGLARGACFMADSEPRLQRLPGAKPFPTLDFWVLTHPDLRDSPRIKVVMKFLADTLIAKEELIRGNRPAP